MAPFVPNKLKIHLGTASSHVSKSGPGYCVRVRTTYTIRIYNHVLLYTEVYGDNMAILSHYML